MAATRPPEVSPNRLETTLPMPPNKALRVAALVALAALLLGTLAFLLVVSLMGRGPVGEQLGLTEFGASLLEHEQKVVEEVEAAGALAQHRQAAPSGRLRISAPGDFANIGLTGVLTEFMKRYPAVTVELDLSPRRVDLVGENFDIAIRMGDLPQDSTLHARRVALERPCARAFVHVFPFVFPFPLDPARGPARPPPATPVRPWAPAARDQRDGYGRSRARVLLAGSVRWSILPSSCADRA